MVSTDFQFGKWDAGLRYACGSSGLEWLFFRAVGTNDGREGWDVDEGLFSGGLRFWVFHQGSEL